MSIMADQPRPLVAGNWKMNGLAASLAELNDDRRAGGRTGAADLMVCPPATLVIAALPRRRRDRRSRSAGRIATPRPPGAFTGDIAAEMLADAGAKAVIVGHSERRDRS